MNKDILYSGHTTTPSDYECPDGQLALSLNLISEDSHVRPLHQPTVVLQLLDNEKVLFIHTVPGQRNYILARTLTDGSTLIYWLKKSASTINTLSAVYITSTTGLLDIEAVGNTLILALSDGLNYILWRDDAYHVLGARPPFVSIDFGMSKMSTLNDSKTFTIPGRCSPGGFTQAQQPTAEQLAQFTQSVYSLLNPAITDKVSSQGYFYQPFFVRYAYRMYDGSYIRHSAPILMLPTVIPPLIRYSDPYTEAGGHGAVGDTTTATLTLNIDYFALAYRILDHDAQSLAAWHDIITGIDIFVSPAIYTYDQSADLPAITVTSSYSLLLSFYDWNPDNLDLRPLPDGSSAVSVPSSVFVGHYADNLNDRYIDHSMSTGAGSSSSSNDIYNVVNIRPHSRFHDNIRSAHDFYKVAEIPLDAITTMASMEFLKLSADSTSTTALVTRPALPDDYQSSCRLVASSLYGFNSRLNLAGVSISPSEPFTLRSSTQFSNPDDTALAPTITVWTRINGVKCRAVHQGLSTEAADLLFSPTSNFPRFIYYPDAAAYKMEIALNASRKFIIDLTPHDFLNGAYYYNDNFTYGSIPVNATTESPDCPTIVPVASKIYTSEVNNPFNFPLLGINAIGSGQILAICSAAKPLSQGQFGQFPLYAFTTEGVWALETTATGSYSARQPITRDVCNNPHSITQLDSSVLFTTDRGIMLISGSQTQCISDIVNSDTPFNPLSLHGFDLLHSLLGHSDTTCLPLAPFPDFLTSCHMIYDYTHQRIIVTSDSHSYAYVYSLKSGHWGMMHLRINDVVNSYPDSLAVDSNHRLVDFSSSDSSNVNALLLTRPIKLDAPDFLKTVDSVIQRGFFRNGHVQSVIYGSRDLFHWHMLWSSKDHRLRGFRGTPYKYFRLALLCSLSPDETITGASLQFNVRHADIPR